MGKIIACTNEKGGVAKTTTVKNLAIGLAREGQNVLVIDLDPSSGLTKSLGFRPENYKNNIHSIFEKTIGLEKLESDFGIIQHPEGIQLIPGSERLREFEYRMMAAAQRETILRRYIYGIRQQYDYIFIDCPAGLGIYTTNALYSADSIIIPVIPHSLDVESMQILFKKIHEVRTLNGTRKKPELMGILFSIVDKRTVNDRKIIKKLRSDYKNIHIFETEINKATNIPASDPGGQSIFKYAASSVSAQVFNDLVGEVLNCG